MPKGDQTDPMRQGLKSGRAVGSCVGTQSPGYANGESGCGFGRGRGRGKGGRGWRHQFRATGKTGRERAQPKVPSAGSVALTAASESESAKSNTEAQQLRQQLEALQAELVNLQQRLHQLENKGDQQPETVGTDRG